MCMEKSEWERVVEFHGHACPGLAIGYRVAKVGLETLSSCRDEDEELVAIVENDACGVDAVMVLTGCTLGKGNLIYRDYGKWVFTFMTRSGGKAVRISVNGSVWPKDDVYRRLRSRVFAGEVHADERKAFYLRQQELIEHILHLPVEQLCKVEQLSADPPPRARIFESVECSLCGEPVAEVRARVRNGKIVCIPCTEEYSRGW